MTAIRTDPNSTKYYVPDLLVCRIKVDPELVMLCQQKGDSTHRGTPIGKLKELWPFDGFRREVIEQANEFVRLMSTQGNDLQGSVYAMELWGPYRDRPMNAEMVNIEEGNHLIPEGKWAMAGKGAWQPETLGPRLITNDLLYRDDFRHGICYRLRGNFLKTRGTQDETTGLVVV